MRTPIRILLSLIFGLPVMVIFGLILYLLITRYDDLFPGVLGPVLVLLEIVLAPYGLSLIVMNYRQLKKDGWKKTFFENVNKPMFLYLPAILGAAFLIFIWFYISQYSIQLAIPSIGANQFTFLMAFLIFLREAFEVPHRFYMIRKATEGPAHAGMEDIAPLKLSLQQQKIGAVIQSLASLAITWGGMLIIGFLLENLLQEWLSNDSLIGLYVICWIVWFVWIQRVELRLEKQYRELNYIPWKAQYK